VSDPEIAKRLQAALKRKGIDVLTGAKVKSARITEKKDVVLELEGKAALEIECRKALVCVGRQPNITGTGLEEAGVKTSKNGIVVDKRMKTTVDNIFAIGDVIGGHMYAHAASYEGMVACDNILGQRREADYSAVPACIFTDPDVASVGINEAVAREKKLEFNKASFHFRSLGKAHVLGRIDGMIKVVSQKTTGRILGVDIIGASATDLIAEATLAIKMGATLEDLVWTVHAHPTMAEMLLEVSHKGIGKPIHSV
jgi:dihydrolipoamide dehydrogenase